MWGGGAYIQTNNNYIAPYIHVQISYQSMNDSTLRIRRHRRRPIDDPIPNSIPNPIRLFPPLRPVRHFRRPLARRQAIARRNIQSCISEEEIPRSQVQRDRVDRHDGEVFGSCKMCHAERVPQDDVCIFDAFVAVRGDPGWQALCGVTGGLGHVSASGVDLVVAV